MQETAKVKLWLGRWQQQDAEWAETVESGEWRLRPLAQDEIATFPAATREGLEELKGKSTGLPYVLVARLRGKLGFIRVPLFPRGESFWTLEFYTAGKATTPIELKSSDFAELASRVCDRYNKAPGVELELEYLGKCAVCRREFVTADPVVRFRTKSSNRARSAHFLCGVVKSSDILGRMIGTGIYVDPVEKLSLTPEKLALIEQAADLVNGPLEDITIGTDLEQFRQGIHKLCREIGSLTPFREEIPKEAIAPVGRFFDSLVENIDRRSALKSDQKPGRNDPCSCGSGQKYKRCCGGVT